MSNKKKDLLSFRKKYIQELEKNVEVWKEIRDNPDESGRDRIEAAKNIAKVLGAFSVASAPDKDKETSRLSKEDKDTITRNVRTIFEQLDKESNEEY